MIQTNNKVEYVSLLSALIYKPRGDFELLSDISISNGVISHYYKNSKTYNPNKRSFIELKYSPNTGLVKVYSWNKHDSPDVIYKQMFKGKYDCSKPVRTI